MDHDRILGPGMNGPDRKEPNIGAMVVSGLIALILVLILIKVFFSA